MEQKINSLSKEEQDKLLFNDYGVNKINLHESVQHFCPLGEQVGVTKYEIEVKPGSILAELIQLHWDIMDLMGKTFTLESGAAEVMKIVKSHYKDAKYVKVVSSCDSNRHMAVDVQLEYFGE